MLKELEKQVALVSEVLSMIGTVKPEDSPAAVHSLFRNFLRNACREYPEIIETQRVYSEMRQLEREMTLRMDNFKDLAEKTEILEEKIRGKEMLTFPFYKIRNGLRVLERRFREVAFVRTNNYNDHIQKLNQDILETFFGPFNVFAIIPSDHKNVIDMSGSIVSFVRKQSPTKQKETMDRLQRHTIIKSFFGKWIGAVSSLNFRFEILQKRKNQDAPFLLQEDAEQRFFAIDSHTIFSNVHPEFLVEAEDVKKNGWKSLSFIPKVLQEVQWWFTRRFLEGIKSEKFQKMDERLQKEIKEQAQKIGDIMREVLDVSESLGDEKSVLSLFALLPPDRYSFVSSYLKRKHGRKRYEEAKRVRQVLRREIGQEEISSLTELENILSVAQLMSHRDQTQLAFLLEWDSGVEFGRSLPFKKIRRVREMLRNVASLMVEQDQCEKIVDFGNRILFQFFMKRIEMMFLKDFQSLSDLYKILTEEEKDALKDVIRVYFNSLLAMDIAHHPSLGRRRPTRRRIKESPLWRVLESLNLTSCAEEGLLKNKYIQP